MPYYLYREDSGHEEIITAASTNDAKKQAMDLLRDGAWPPGWVEARLWEWDEDEETKGEQIDAYIAVFIEPKEPECTEAEHDWRGHPDIGLAENPGCMGIGGAAIRQTDICLHCGMLRITIAGDTNPIGAGNRDSVTFGDPVDADELARVREHYDY